MTAVTSPDSVQVTVALLVFLRKNTSAWTVAFQLLSARRSRVAGEAAGKNHGLAASAAVLPWLPAAQRGGRVSSARRPAWAASPSYRASCVPAGQVHCTVLSRGGKAGPETLALILKTSAAHCFNVLTDAVLISSFTWQYYLCLCYSRIPAFILTTYASYFQRKGLTLGENSLV